MSRASERRVVADELRLLVGQVFARCGVVPADADLLADTLVAADLRGVHSHGVLRVPDYAHKLTHEGVDPRGRPAVVRDEGACLVVDGGNSMGQIGCHFAMQQAIARAARTGVAVVAIRGSNHCGAMAYYACQALAHDMIGLATTNALPTMAPWGGAERIVGINPLGVAIPAGQERPIIYDAAFSGSSHGKIRVYAQRGQPIPAGWATDHEGRPTTDALAALDGLLQPIGAFKGVALAMLMGILAAMLSEASYGTALGDMQRGPTAGADGHLVAALRISAFTDPARFKAQVDGAIREVHASRRAPGVERLYAPGEIEFLSEERYRREGIPLNTTTLSDLARTAAALGVDAAPYAWLRDL